MAHGQFSLNLLMWMDAVGAGAILHVKGSIGGERTRGKEAAWLGGSMHVIDGVEVARGDGLRDGYGRYDDGVFESRIY